MKVDLVKKDGARVYRYKVSENVFGLVQIRGAFCIFFDIFFEYTDQPIKIDLNGMEVLHHRFVATQMLEDFFVKEETGIQLYGYDADFLVLDFFYKAPPNIYGVNLSKLPKNLDMLPLELVIADLSVDKHYDELIKYDLIGMIGSTEKIRDRLKIYLETGADFDPSKNFIFPDLLPKPKEKLPRILSRNDLKRSGYID